MNGFAEKTKYINILEFFVNGKKVCVVDPDPETSLLTYLRQNLRLTGTKLGCGEGGCGACTVMISAFQGETEKKIIHYSANACLLPLCSLHGLAVTTVEGIGSIKDGMHPVQERIAKSHGSQCGFCTPGIVMSMYTLLRNNSEPERNHLEDAFQGNLCRCTGYRPILDAFNTFTKGYVGKGCAMGDQCCRNVKNGESKQRFQGVPLVDESSFSKYDPTQEVIFPSELQLEWRRYQEASLEYRGERVTWFRPTSLDELLFLKSQFPNAKLIGGNTEIGVEQNTRLSVFPVQIALSAVSSLRNISKLEDGVMVGGTASLADIENYLKDEIKQLPSYKCRGFKAVMEMLRWFAGPQIRNVATLAGNLATSSPISDLAPVMMAISAKLIVARYGFDDKEVAIDKNFFTAYRKNSLSGQDVIKGIVIPFSKQDEHILAIKQAQRRDDDIAIVNACFRVELASGSNTIKAFDLCFGGMAETTKSGQKTSEKLIGLKWNNEMLETGCQALQEEFKVNPGAPGGMESYRQTLAISFFFKFYHHVSGTLGLKTVQGSEDLGQPYYRVPSESSQMYQAVDEEQDVDDLIGRSVAHNTANQQATGEAIYIDDLPPRTDELYLALVTSTEAHANLVSVNYDEALKMPGIIRYISCEDIPGSNMTGCIVKDEEIFAEKKVTCVGQVIGAIIGDSKAHAQRAAKKVKVVYEKLPALITIEEAISAGSFFTQSGRRERGDIEAGFQMSDIIIEGEVKLGGQEHFYLETQACLAIPEEENDMRVYSSSQSPGEAQTYCADALGVGKHNIHVHVKRLGGGFGGKQTSYKVPLLQSVVSAHVLKRPVRCMLDRHEDMIATGKRHPFLGKYKVGFMKSGKIIALELDMYSNAGNTLDLSGAVMEKALFTLDNCYFIPNVKARGRLCQTNIQSNCAFRGFGAPQGMLICETWIQHIADTLQRPAEEIRSLNLYSEGQSTPYGHVIPDPENIHQCWQDVINCSEFLERKVSVESFNKEHTWTKRGLAVIPTKFGVSFSETFLNQAGALVHVYNDGSVLVAHSATEMGQGVNVKMLQVASKALGIPIGLIHISDTSTVTVPNTSPTAASVGSDLSGMAIIDACQRIMDRLQTFREQDPTMTWKDLVSKAYFNRVSLSASGFYRTPGLDWDHKKLSGIPYAYYAYGVACSEVEIDCLTGNHTVIRTDVVMDVGKSMNPAIDIGQIEGGFIQGYGLFTLEDLRYSSTGQPYSRGPGAYKIPGFTDIPLYFNVHLLKNSANPKAVHSSKATGEPPLFLAASVFFAIRDAICSARKQFGLQNFFQFDSPATSERIRMACQDHITDMVPGLKAGSYKPWFAQL